MAPFSARQLVVLGLVTLISRLALAYYLGVFGEPERWEYDVIAGNIVSGLGHTYLRADFVYLAYAPPAWSYVLAFLLLFSWSARETIQLVQALFCFGAAIAHGTMAFRMSGSRTAALVAAYLVALQPSLLYYSVVNSDPLPLNVMLLGLLAVSGTDLIRKPDPTRAAAFGLLLAVAVLSRGTPFVALPIVFVSLIAGRRPGAMVAAVVMAATLALGVAPWLMRNERLLGRTLITTTASENFWRGNHEGATGGVRDVGGGTNSDLHRANEALPAAIRDVLQNGTEIDRQDVFWKEAMSYLRQNPWEGVTLLGEKLKTFWWKIESNPGDYSQVASFAYEVIYRTELALALVGAAFLYRARPPVISRDRMAAGFALSLMVAISLLQSAFYVQGRHRFLIEPLLLMFSACGLLGIGRLLRNSLVLRGFRLSWPKARLRARNDETRHPAGVHLSLGFRGCPSDLDPGDDGVQILTPGRVLG